MIKTRAYDVVLKKDKWKDGVYKFNFDPLEGCLDYGIWMGDNYRGGGLDTIGNLIILTLDETPKEDILCHIEVTYPVVKVKRKKDMWKRTYVIEKR